MDQPIVKLYIIFKNEEARIVGKEHLKAELVARMYVDGKASIDEVMEHYTLTRAQVYGALAYYYENQTLLDEAYERSWAESKGINTTDWRKIIDERYAEKEKHQDK